MKSLNRTTPAMPVPANQKPSLRRFISLTPGQAGRWLVYLDRTAQSQQTMPACLQQLRSELTDAAWLGRWKRESAQMELCPMLMADIFSELAQLSQHNHCKRDFDVLEEMLVVLCIDQHPAG